MNLYLLTRPEELNFGTWEYGDCYAGAVVRANSEDEARMMHPRGNLSDISALDTSWDGTKGQSWIDAKDVKVELIGKAPDGAAPGVVFAAYTAP